MGEVILGGWNNKPRAQASYYMIEGESVTIKMIAKRLKVTPATAAGRMNKVKQMDGPVTWKRLKEAGR